MPRFTLRSMLAAIGVVSVYFAGWATATITHDRELRDEHKLVESFMQREREMEQVIIKRNKQLLLCEPPCE